jgi:coenzyme F420 hydrogenase subunit beta
MIAPQHFTESKYRNVEGILKIVKDGLCHRCGACVGVCPVGTFGLSDRGYPIQVADCIHCNVCVQSCSGIEVDYNTLGARFFDGKYKYGSLLGPVEKSFIGHAVDPEIRKGGASGGVVTQLFAHLLEAGVIKGAVVVVADDKNPALGKGIVARTREQLLASQQSRYTTAPHLSALQEIQNEDGPFALVGLPCQVHSLRKRQLVDPRWKERVPLVVGLLCHFNLPVEASLDAGAVFTPRGRTIRQVDYRQKDDGHHAWPNNTLQITFDDGNRWESPLDPAKTFNIISRSTRLGRCLSCLDAGAEFSDLAVGDPWIRNERGTWKYEHPMGWSGIIVHTPYGAKVLQDALAAGKMILREIPTREVSNGQHAMLEEKKQTTLLRLRARKWFGLRIPDYKGLQLPKVTARIARKELTFWLMRLLPALPPVRKLLLRIGFSRIGVFFVRRRQLKRIRQAAAGKIRIMSSDVGDTVEKFPV